LGNAAAFAAEAPTIAGTADEQAGVVAFALNPP
jgi:hypothetical protein